MITFKNASFSYGDTPILRDVSIELLPGSFHFLTGPSGAGKSTLLKMIYLALRPSSGEMRIFGLPTAPLDSDGITDMRRRIGVVHQDCAFLDHMSVEDNIGLPMRVQGRARSAYQEDLRDLITWVGLESRAQALPPELSGGERQRAALARAVLTSPEIIVADEPTGNVDWGMGQRILTLLVELNRLGKSVLVATHDLNLIRAAKGQVEARVLRIDGGRVIQAGATL